MGCLLAIVALAVPRVVLFVAFLVTDWFTRAFTNQLWPILGFLFMPYTTLAYIAAMLNNNHVVAGGWLVLLVVAVIVDVGHWGGGHRYWRGSRG
ncbi:MAG: hypothetical protein H7831_05825 [Magnetococcus sp. WYHC-3]